MEPKLLKIYGNEYNEYLEKLPEEEQPDRIYYDKGL